MSNDPPIRYADDVEIIPSGEEQDIARVVAHECLIA